MVEDYKIIELYFERNEQAIAATASKYGRLCSSIARQILADAEDVEECVNDTYLSMWNSIPLHRPDNLMAYVAKITHNLALKKLRYNSAGKRAQTLTVSLGELKGSLPDARTSVEEQTELTQMMNEFLNTQKRLARNVFIRKYWFYDTIPEIARRYSCSESKVKSMLYHTRLKLQEYLEKEGMLP